jgi:hypothetical protein
LAASSGWAGLKVSRPEQLEIEYHAAKERACRGEGVSDHGLQVAFEPGLARIDALMRLADFAEQTADEQAADNGAAWPWR